MKNICIQCGAEFESSRKRKYCCERCKSKYKYQNGKRKLICKNCGKEFFTCRKDIRFCCKKCATIYVRNVGREQITFDDIQRYIFEGEKQYSVDEVCLHFNISVRKLYYTLKQNGFSSYKEFIEYTNGAYIEKYRSDVSISSLYCFDKIASILNESYKLEKEFPGLINPKTGRSLRIDCYFEDTNIAVEYNGKQHYEYIPYFHNSPNELSYQKYKDKLKADFCRKNNIPFVVIKYDDELTDEYFETILRWVNQQPSQRNAEESTLEGSTTNR